MPYDIVRVAPQSRLACGLAPRPCWPRTQFWAATPTIYRSNFLLSHLAMRPEIARRQSATANTNSNPCSTASGPVLSRGAGLRFWGMQRLQVPVLSRCGPGVLSSRSVCRFCCRVSYLSNVTKRFAVVSSERSSLSLSVSILSLCSPSCVTRSASRSSRSVRTLANSSRSASFSASR